MSVIVRKKATDHYFLIMTFFIISPYSGS